MKIKRCKKIGCSILAMMAILFLSCAHVQAEDAQVQVLAKTSSSWDGTPLPSYPEGKPEVTILRIEIPPGARLPWHRHPVINAGVLLKGQLTVESEDHHTLHLKAGDSIVELVNKWHYGKNEGKTPAEIIVFYAGVEGTPITEKK